MTTTTTPAARTSPADITERAIASFDSCPDPRLKQIMQSLVKHLHAFATEVRLTETEWERAVQILTATGHITDDKRQEFILWSDTLGLSMLVDSMAAERPSGAMESTVLGPFWTPDAPKREFAESMIESSGGTPAYVFGRVTDTDGNPIAGAELDVWQNGADGLYTVQHTEGPEDHLRGRYYSRDDGSYAFVGVRPVPYTVPADGPVGKMLEISGRHPWRPAHIHMIVSAPGFLKLPTHIFDAESAYLDTDAVFAYKPSLVREFEPRRPEDPERPASIPQTEWCAVRNDIVLARA